MYRRAFIGLLLVFSFFFNGIACGAKTEDPIWRYIKPDWPWGENEWDTAWGAVRELASDDTGRFSQKEMTFTIPEGQEVLNGAGTDFPFDEARNKITAVKLPESLRIIEGLAFTHLRFLKRITIPAGVTEVGDDIFENCENLREIENLSSQTISLRRGDMAIDERYYRGPSGLDYYVDGEKVTEVSPGKTAIGKGKIFSLKYNLNGGKITGEKVKTYRYGERETSLPKAKRKGFIFLGWSFYKHDTDFRTWFRFYDEIGLISGDKTLTARWKKVRVKKTGKKKIQIQLYNRNYEDEWKIACLYSTKKSMKDAKLVGLGEDFDNAIKKGTIQGTKTKNCVTNYYPKKKLLTADLKKLKKGKTYYLQFRRINDIANGCYFMNKKVLKTVKVKL